jgi:hypothetical protein
MPKDTPPTPRPTPGEGLSKDNHQTSVSLAAELKQQSDRLLKLADRLATTSEQGQSNGNHRQPLSLADELKQESGRLRELADGFSARAKYLAEMEENYPYFKKEVYARLIEQALAEVPPLPDDVDLSKLVKEEGWQQLSEFIDDL